MRSPRVTSVLIPGGRRLTVRAWDGEGDPLVLLHGLLDSSEGWADFAERTPRPCLAIDLPGFGGSDLPVHPRIDAYVMDVAAGLNRLGVRRATLVGHSLGGAVAAGVAERARGIDALVLLAPAGFGRISLAEALTKPVIIDLATAALPLALVNPLTVTAMYSTFVSRGRLPERELVDRLRSRASSAPQAVRAATVAIAHAGRQPRNRLSFSGPVAALWGANDALVPTAHAKGLLRALPQADIAFWPGMGHHPQRERPRQLAHFVERCAAAADQGRPPLADSA